MDLSLDLIQILFNLCRLNSIVAKTYFNNFYSYSGYFALAVNHSSAEYDLLRTLLLGFVIECVQTLLSVVPLRTGVVLTVCGSSAVFPQLFFHMLRQRRKVLHGEVIVEKDD